MAKNKSPAFANRESVQEFLIFNSPVPFRISASQASATNFKERSSTKLFQQKRRGHHRRDGFVHRAGVVHAFATRVAAVQRRNLEHAHFRVVQIRDAPAALDRKSTRLN